MAEICTAFALAVVAAVLVEKLRPRKRRRVRLEITIDE